MEYSPKTKLIAADWRKWFKNLRVFFAPLALFYLLSVLSKASIDPTKITLETFYLTPEVRGACILYALNAAIDIINRFKNENSYKE